MKPEQSVTQMERRASPTPTALIKPDPYASRTHRRIDLVLLVATIIILFLVLHASAHGQTLNRVSSDRGGSSINGNGSGKGNKPKPTPTPAPVDAQISWDNNATGQRDFNTNTNWTGNTLPGSNDVAAFSGTQKSQPNLSANITVGGLYFTSTASGYSLTANASVTLSLAGTGTSAIVGGGSSNAAPAIQADNTTGTTNISAPIALAPASGSTSTIYQNTGGTLAISGVISGSGITLNKIGGGTLTLGTTANTYSGDTTISAGTINIGGTGTPLGSGTNLNMSGGTLNTTADRGTGVNSLSQNVVVTANSTISTTSTGATVNLNFTGTLSGTAGTLAFQNASTSTTNLFDVRFSGGDFTMDRPIALTSNGVGGKTQLTDANATGTTHTYNGVISGDGSFRRLTGTTGTTIFNGNNTYTGTTTVNAGKLFINGDQTSATGATTINNSGSLLGGTGTIGGAVSIANSGAILLGGTGSTGQTLTIKGALSMASGSIIQLALGPTGTHSTLALTGAGASSFATTQHFNFIELGTTAGTYQDIITGVTSNPFPTDTFTIDNAGWAGTFSWDGSNIDLTLTAVPEPGTWLAAALAAISFAIFQRRRLARLVRLA